LVQRDHPSALISAFHSLRQRMTILLPGSASRISPLSATRPSSNLSVHFEPGLQSVSAKAPNQYFRIVAGSVSATQSLSAVVLMWVTYTNFGLFIFIPPSLLPTPSSCR